MKRVYKSDIAEAAGVSMRTFTRWMSVHRVQLTALGLQPHDKCVGRRALEYICREYDVEMEELAGGRSSLR